MHSAAFFAAAVSDIGVEALKHRFKLGFNVAQGKPFFVQLVAAGLQNKEIAQRLGLSLATVRNHVHNSLEKLDAVKKHFMSVLADARKELLAKYPDPQQMKAAAGLDRYRKAYEAAVSKLNSPTRAKAASAVILDQAEAAIDVDKLSDHVLVERILADRT